MLNYTVQTAGFCPVICVKITFII